MKRPRKHQSHDNEDRWLLTYSDLITLLLGLFVILYSISKVDAGKYAEIASALNGVFGSPRGILTGNPVCVGSAGIQRTRGDRATIWSRRSIPTVSRSRSRSRRMNAV